MHRRKVQIFATDIDDQALEVARAGRYAEASVRDISPARLERFFLKDGNSYRVAKEVREMCIFSLHNLIEDAPFSRLDLISCQKSGESVTQYRCGDVSSVIAHLW
jgi:two-component system, chemotaxis family, CheB/CheR fusion protein